MTIALDPFAEHWLGSDSSERETLQRKGGALIGTNPLT
jgi:hypothetical protein